MLRFLYGHTEWVETRDLTLGNFDSHLRIKDTALWSFPICLYREAMHLQCFPPMRYVRGGALRTRIHDMTTFARFVQKWNMGIEPACTVRLYNAVCLYYVDFPDNFFFCLVCWLAWKKQIKIYTFLNFQCHFHCQVISKNVLVKTKATTMLLSRWSSSLSVTSKRCQMRALVQILPGSIFSNIFHCQWCFVHIYFNRIEAGQSQLCHVSSYYKCYKCRQTISKWPVHCLSQFHQQDFFTDRYLA